MNYLGILLEYLRSVECKFSPLGDLSGGTHTHAIAYGVSLLLSRTGMVSVGNLDESEWLQSFLYVR